MVLDTWLGRGKAEIKENAAKLRYRFTSVDGLQRTLKIEINTREHGAVDGYEFKKFALANRWFTGEATIRTFTIEELLATKLRALLQRRKGRDLFDLDHAMTALPDAEWSRIPDLLSIYLAMSGQTISRAVAEERLFDKIGQLGILADMRSLVPNASSASLTDEAAVGAVLRILERITPHMAGDAWSETEGRLSRLVPPRTGEEADQSEKVDSAEEHIDLARRIVEAARERGDIVEDALADTLSIYVGTAELKAILGMFPSTQLSIGDLAADLGIRLPGYDV